MEKNMEEQINAEFKDFCVKHNLKYAILSSECQGRIMTMAGYEPTASNSFQAALCLGRSWQAMREWTKKTLDSFENQWK